MGRPRNSVFGLDSRGTVPYPRLREQEEASKTEFSKCYSRWNN